MYIERVTSRKRFVSRCEGWDSVAGEGRVIGVPKFHSWGKSTMPLTNINSDWMSNASSGLCNTLHFFYKNSCTICTLDTWNSMYPSYRLDLDLVQEATGVHWEEFLVMTCRPGTPSMMLKHTFAFWECKFLHPFQSHFQSCGLIGSVSGDDQEETCVKHRMVVEVSFYACR